MITTIYFAQRYIRAALGYFGRRQTCDFRKHAISAPAEPGGETHNVSRNQARAQVLLQARKLHRLWKWHVWCILGIAIPAIATVAAAVNP